MTEFYKQGYASLGFPGGPSVTLRLNPNAVDWNFQINTSVTETIGGRVVQVLGATLSDLTIYGSYGESRGRSNVKSRDYAEAFLSKMKQMAEWQARDASRHAPMHSPAVFSFPAKGWRFQVYIKDLTDPDGGGGVTHRPGKFSYDYVLTMMIHADLSDTSKILGKSNGAIATSRDKAIESYITRIADGIGWRFTEYNGQGGTAQVARAATNTNTSRSASGSRTSSSSSTSRARVSSGGSGGLTR